MEIGEIFSFNYFEITIIGKIQSFPIIKNNEYVDIELSNTKIERFVVRYMKNTKVLDIDDTYFRLLESVSKNLLLYAR
jgi:hypothetical protein